VATTTPHRAISSSVLGWILSSAAAYSLSSSGSNSLSVPPPSAVGILVCSAHRRWGLCAVPVLARKSRTQGGALIVVSPENQLGQTGGLQDKSFESGEVIARIPYGTGKCLAALPTAHVGPCATVRANI
jgi:hypothetical protein